MPDFLFQQFTDTILYVCVSNAFLFNITHIDKNIITFFNQKLTQNKHKSVYRVNKAKAQSLKFPTSNYFNINLLAIHITCSYVTTIKSLAKKIDGKSPFRVHTQLSSWGQWWSWWMPVDYSIARGDMVGSRSPGTPLPPLRMFLSDRAWGSWFHWDRSIQWDTHCFQWRWHYGSGLPTDNNTEKLWSWHLSQNLLSIHRREYM